MSAAGGPIIMPEFDPNTLTFEWSEVLVVTDSRIPRGSRLYRRKCDDGFLSCLVVKMRGAYSVQVVHVSRPTEPEHIVTTGRPASLVEILDCLNRFTPKGTPFAFGLVSAGHPAPPFNVAELVVLTQCGPNISGVPNLTVLGGQQ